MADGAFEKESDLAKMLSTSVGSGRRSSGEGCSVSPVLVAEEAFCVGVWGALSRWIVCPLDGQLALEKQ